MGNHEHSPGHTASSWWLGPITWALWVVKIPLMLTRRWRSLTSQIVSALLSLLSVQPVELLEMRRGSFADLYVWASGNFHNKHRHTQEGHRFLQGPGAAKGTSTKSGQMNKAQGVFLPFPMLMSWHIPIMSPVEGPGHDGICQWPWNWSSNVYPEAAWSTGIFVPVYPSWVWPESLQDSQGPVGAWRAWEKGKGMSGVRWVRPAECTAVSSF